MVGQPFIEWQDLTWLIPDIENKCYHEDILLNPPVRLIRRSSSPKLILFEQLRNARKGESIAWVDKVTGEIREYSSRSGAEAAIITELILMGWDFDEILNLFEQMKPNHYVEHTNPNEYLRITYNNAVKMLSENEPRDKIANAYYVANTIPWPGRGGEYEQKVMCAILAKGWQFNTLQPRISRREISEHAGISKLEAIKHTLDRLQNNGIIQNIDTKRNETSQFDISLFVKSVNEVHISQQISSYINNPVTNVYQNDISSWKTADSARVFL